MNMDLPRVLVTSIDVWNNTSGSDTFTNLLSGYDSSKIANVYFRSGIPSSDSADKYFYICESAIIKSIINRGIKTGWEVERNEEEKKRKIDLITDNERKRYSFFSRHRFRIFLFAREICWKYGKWKSEELDAFVKDFDPDVLFFPIESYIHFNRVNNYLIERTGASAIAYIWDDNFTYKAHRDVGFLIQRYFVRKSVRKLIEKAEKVYVINEKMQRELKNEFGVESEVLTKGASVPQFSGIKRLNHPLKMVYTGKLIYGRLETIQIVAEVLDELNHDNIKIEFEIYSGTKLSEEQIQKLDRKGVHFCGSVSQDKVAEIQNGADILLLAEALDGKHKYDARLSFSTKLVDYLAAGKCIVAVGPHDIASLEYLREKEVAMVASSKDELMIILSEKINDSTIIEYGNRSRTLAIERHNIEAIQRELYKAFISVSSK